MRSARATLVRDAQPVGSSPPGQRDQQAAEGERQCCDGRQRQHHYHYQPYVEKTHFDPVPLTRVPKTYVLCSRGEFADVTKVATRKIANVAAGANWALVELPSWHVPMATMPDRVSEVLLAF